MYVRKVIRENIHNIPIGTYIHSFSFHDKKDETSRVEMWKSESCIVWRTEEQWKLSGQWRLLKCKIKNMKSNNIQNMPKMVKKIIV